MSVAGGSQCECFRVRSGQYLRAQEKAVFFFFLARVKVLQPRNPRQPRRLDPGRARSKLHTSPPPPLRAGVLVRTLSTKTLHSPISISTWYSYYIYIEIYC